MKTNSMSIADLYLTEGPISYKEDPFRVVWRKQMKLMEAYREAGRLSNWPISIEDKQGQQFYRELFGFLEEEIIEASQEAENLLNAAEQNSGTDVSNYLITLNEEIADTLHFWIETFIFLGWMPKTLELYYEQLSQEHYLNSGLGEIFKLAFQFANNYLNRENILNPNNEGFSSVSMYTLRGEPQVFEQAGSKISKETLKLYEEYTFKTIKHLQLAKNCLKNKYWKSKEYDTNIEAFQQQLMEAWLNWTISLALLNLRPAQLVQNFLLKNKINHNKITTH